MSYPTQTARTLTIASCTALSPALSLEDEGVVAIIMPDTWDGSKMSFQVSYDNDTFRDMYISGSEYMLDVSACRALMLSPDVFRGFRYLKARSGWAASTTAACGAKTLTFITRVL